MFTSARRILDSLIVPALRTPAKHRRQARRTKLTAAIESLEDRCLLSVLTVTTAQDRLDAIDGVLSLREAILIANDSSGATSFDGVSSTDAADTIVFDGSVFVSNDTIFLESGQLPAIVEELMIDGRWSFSTTAGRVAIDAQANSRLVENGAALALADLVLKNGFVLGDSGGAILNLSSGVLSLNGVDVLDSIASLLDPGENGGWGGGLFNLGEATIVSSMFAGNSADFGGAIFNEVDATVTIANSDISSNTANIHGGGISNEGSATIRNSALTANEGSVGGGLFNGGELLLIDSTISGNRIGSFDPGNGAGIYNGGDATIQNSRISGNAAPGNFGGGISNSGNLTITSANINSNTAVFGGGIQNDGTISISDSTIADNLAIGGAGIWNAGGNVLVQSSTISGNAAEYGGGILVEEDGAAALQSVTIASNTASLESFGGGVYVGAGTVSAVSSIVADNVSAAGADFNGSLTDLGFNLIENTDGLTFATGQAASTLVNVDPLLGPLQDNGGPTRTHALLPGSPAVNAGANPTEALSDQRGSGFNRTSGTATDIGAFEVQTTSLVVTTHEDIVSDGDAVLSLREAILIANDSTGATSFEGISSTDVADTIVFDASVFILNDTIFLTLGQLPVITEELTIDGVIGSGSERVTIDAQNAARVFQNVSSLSLESLVIRNGFVTDENGGALLNQAAAWLSMNGVDVLDSMASQGPLTIGGSGGGLFNLGEATISSSNINGNTAVFGGGIQNDGTISIADSTVSANSAIFDGGGLQNNGTVTIDNSSEISSNTAASGGGVQNNGVLQLGGTSISGNSADDSGGGLQNNGSTIIALGNVVNNTATSGGGIQNNGTLTILDAALSGNMAELGGGIQNQGTASIEDTAIISNTAQLRGGGVHNSGDLFFTINVALAVISNNTANGTAAGDGGGGIYNSKTLVVDGRGGSITIASNTSGLNGGGIFTSSDGTTTVFSATITGNTADEGGGLQNDGTISIADSTISDNLAAFDGGGLQNNGTATIINSSLDGNTAVFGGGLQNNGAVDLVSSFVSNNSADSGGGVQNNGTAFIVDSSIVANVAASDGGGLQNNGSATISISNVDDNTAAFGGGVQNNDLLTITQSLITGNVATDRGGGLQNDATATVFDSTVGNNTAALGGGVENTDTLVIDFSGVSGNAASISGGGVFNSGTATLELSVGSISIGGNASSGVLSGEGGGGIFNAGSLIISGTGGILLIETNTAAFGGGVYNALGGAATITNARIAANTATEIGGGIFNGGDLTIDNSGGDVLISGNAAGGAANGNGGGVFNLASGTLVLDGTGGSVEISSNTSDFSGGGVLNSGTATIINVLISGNTAVNGGGVLNNGTAAALGVLIADNVAVNGGGVENSGTLAITSSTLAGNSATDGGGLQNSGTATITGSSLLSNTAVSNGGGVQNNGSVTIDTSSVDGNTSIFGGGVQSNGDATIINSALSGNAADWGGGIHAAGTLSITDSSVDGNTATFGGGGIANSGDTDITGSVIAGNTAGSGGGVLNAGDMSIHASAGDVQISGNLANGTADGEGGGGISNDGTLTIDGTGGAVVIADNTAELAGGGVLNSAGGTAAIIEAMISNNTANVNSLLSSEGGGGAFNAGTMTIGGAAGTIAISGNRAANLSSGGGLSNAGTMAIDGGPGGTVTISDNAVDSNAGGGVYNTGTLDIAGSSGTVELSGNTAGGNGGGLFSAIGSTTTIDGGAAGTVLISGNRSGIDDVLVGGTGGGVANGGTMTIDAANGAIAISANTALSGGGGFGGGIFSDSGSVLTISGGVSGTVMISANVTVNGGGVYNAGDLTVHTSGGTVAISDNIAQGTTGPGTQGDGGGLYNSGMLDLDGTAGVVEITTNTAALSGGGLFNALDAAARVTNSTIGGNRGFFGGGTNNDRGTVTITTSTLDGNQAIGDGGGLYNAGTAAIAGSTILNNSAEFGGGIDNQAMLTITDSTIAGNAAVEDQGGGLWNASGATAMISNSTISENTASLDGGGIGNVGGLSIIGSTISGNRAGRDGGGLATDGRVNLSESTVSGNTAVRGGGIHLGDGLASLRSVTLALNDASDAGGGVSVGAGALHAVSTIIGDNLARMAPDISGLLNDLGFNLIESTAGGMLIRASRGLDTTVVGVDPRLGPLQDNGGPTQTHALLRGSPAINAGTTAKAIFGERRETGRTDTDTEVTVSLFDQRGTGFRRTVGHQSDIGSFENQTVFPLSPIVVGSGMGGNPEVRVFNLVKNEELGRFSAFDPNLHRGGVHVTMADVNGDGVLDIIASPAYKARPIVRVFDGRDPSGQSVLMEFHPYDRGFLGGLTVGTGDFNGDGNADIVTGAGPGGAPIVKVFSGADRSGQTLLMNFFAYHAGFRGGVNVATGDVDGDGRVDLLTGAGPGGAPIVKVFSGADPSAGTLLQRFFADDPSFRGGVFVASADFDLDSKADVITGAGPGGAPVVKVFSGADRSGQTLLMSLFADSPAFPGGVRVGSGDVDADGVLDVLAAAGPGDTPRVQAFDGITHRELTGFDAFSSTFHGGTFVTGAPDSLAGEEEQSLRAGAGGAPTANTSPLRPEQAQSIVEAAIDRLVGLGLSQSSAALLRTLDVRVADLAGDRLGLAIGGAILLDRDGAGQGWFTDPTPGFDEEFELSSIGTLLATTPGATNRFDLLSVAVHELGHHLGRKHGPAEDWMSVKLLPGERRMPPAGSLAGLDEAFADAGFVGTLVQAV